MLNVLLSQASLFAFSYLPALIFKTEGNCKYKDIQKQGMCERFAYTVLPFQARIHPVSWCCGGHIQAPDQAVGLTTAHEHELPPYTGRNKAVHRLLSCKAAR